MATLIRRILQPTLKATLLNLHRTLNPSHMLNPNPTLIHNPTLNHSHMLNPNPTLNHNP